MNKHTQSVRDDFRQVVSDAQALVPATADVSTESVAKSPKRLTDTLEQGKGQYGDFSGKAYDSALTADEAATKYVYHTIGIIAGAFLGLFAAHRHISQAESK